MDRILTRLQQLRANLEKQEMDAFLVSAPENRYYLSGLSARDPAPNEISAFLVIAPENQILLTDGRYVFQAREECPAYQVVEYRNDAAEAVARAIMDAGCRRVGVEARHLNVHFYHRLASALEGVEVIPSESMVEPLRAVKEEEEIQKIKASAALTARALEEVLPRLKPGLTEKEVAWWIESSMRRQGAEAVAFEPIVASGPNAAKAHHSPSERQLQEGEPLILDIGARLHGYCSDMTRTMVLGEPSARFQEIYTTVRRAQLEALKAIRPGMMSDQLDAVARREIEKAGYGDKFLHSLGHGVGLATHEAPSLARTHPTEIKEGMVVTVEPGIYLEGWGGVRLEQMVVVRNNGAELLTTDAHFYHFQ